MINSLRIGYGKCFFRSLSSGIKNKNLLPAKLMGIFTNSVPKLTRFESKHKNWVAFIAVNETFEEKKNLLQTSSSRSVIHSEAQNSKSELVASKSLIDFPVSTPSLSSKTGLFTAVDSPIKGPDALSTSSDKAPAEISEITSEETEQSEKGQNSGKSEKTKYSNEPDLFYAMGGCFVAGALYAAIVSSPYSAGPNKEYQAVSYLNDSESNLLEEVVGGVFNPEKEQLEDIKHSLKEIEQLISFGSLNTDQMESIFIHLAKLEELIDKYYVLDLRDEFLHKIRDLQDSLIKKFLPPKNIGNTPLDLKQKTHLMEKLFSLKRVINSYCGGNESYLSLVNSRIEEVMNASVQKPVVINQKEGIEDEKIKQLQGIKNPETRMDRVFSLSHHVRSTFSSELYSETVDPQVKELAESVEKDTALWRKTAMGVATLAGGILTYLFMKGD